MHVFMYEGMSFASNTFPSLRPTHQPIIIKLCESCTTPCAWARHTSVDRQRDLRNGSNTRATTHRPLRCELVGVHAPGRGGVHKNSISAAPVQEAAPPEAAEEASPPYAGSALAPAESADDKNE